MKMARYISVFLWGAVTASLWFLVGMFPPDAATWTPILLLLAGLNTTAQIVVIGKFFMDAWTEVEK